jgi:hypothetical protein
MTLKIVKEVSNVFKIDLLRHCSKVKIEELTKFQL